MRQSRPAANGYQALALAAPVAFSGTEGPEMPLRLFQGLSVALTHGVPWGTRWKFAFSPGSARLHERWVASAMRYLSGLCPDVEENPLASALHALGAPSFLPVPWLGCRRVPDHSRGQRVIMPRAVTGLAGSRPWFSLFRSCARTSTRGSVSSSPALAMPGWRRTG